MASDAASRKLVQDILKPFADFRGQWLLHYPVYLNTFCITYDIACLLGQTPTPEARPLRDELGESFIRHDWRTGLPTFTYQRDIEIFVGIPSTIALARSHGHTIEPDHHVLFTRYKFGEVFVRKLGARQPGKWLLVTDIPENGKQLFEAWKKSRPKWLNELGVPSSFGLTENFREDIRESWKRELSDLFAEDGKIYLFSAPMAEVLRQYQKRDSKYILREADLSPVATYFVFRCNSGVSMEVVRALSTAIRRYYRLLLGSRRPADYLHEDLPLNYARIATTVGEQHPFGELEPPNDVTEAVKRRMLRSYADLLAKHHAPVERHRGRAAS